MLDPLIAALVPIRRMHLSRLRLNGTEWFSAPSAGGLRERSQLQTRLEVANLGTCSDPRNTCVAQALARPIGRSLLRETGSSRPRYFTTTSHWRLASPSKSPQEQGAPSATATAPIPTEATEAQFDDAPPSPQSPSREASAEARPLLRSSLPPPRHSGRDGRADDHCAARAAGRRVRERRAPEAQDPGAGRGASDRAGAVGRRIVDVVGRVRRDLRGADGRAPAGGYRTQRCG
ncbi:hypothetical protein NUW58_g6556 [Xylaria curta]|uniref:Uncharacterized protein n=1 Tax=Xylaria curta TaxID=42375 RepID=A0ACC1NTZ9_9PEZI|nr:hypothetical protein NUW58_g6556 [Xylaria curta]